MGNGEWGMGNGEWGAGSGKREAGSGKREAGSGKRKSIPTPGARCNWAVLLMADSICWGADTLRDPRP
ncbi:hypothetical protein E2P69_00985 [Xanthomonas perforans]|nr:hypothetical protein E2P69_00985 [Xanthomonas perforans]TVS71864.1 hypothetical protein E2P70_01435 [Xanthomonas perforans]TVS72289.1 hypothetical protein E2P67_01460 [Xanthomonas perforans]